LIPKRWRKPVPRSVHIWRLTLVIDHITAEYLRIAFQAGARFVIGSDAHSPDRVGDAAKGLLLAETAGIPASAIQNTRQETLQRTAKRYGSKQTGKGMQADLNNLKFVLITGLSGAGKTETVRILEDLGYFCVDNLPPALIPKFAELCIQSEGRINHVALVCDIRGRGFFDHLIEVLEALEATAFHMRSSFWKLPTKLWYAALRRAVADTLSYRKVVC